MSAYHATFSAEHCGDFIIVHDFTRKTGAVSVREEPTAVLRELFARYAARKFLRVIVEEQGDPSSWYEIEFLAGTVLACAPIRVSDLPIIFQQTGLEIA